MIAGYRKRVEATERDSQRMLKRGETEQKKSTRIIEQRRKKIDREEKKLVGRYERILKQSERESSTLQRKGRTLERESKKLEDRPEMKYPFLQAVGTNSHRCVCLNANFSWCERPVAYLHQTMKTRRFGAIAVPICRYHLKSILQEATRKTYARGFYFESDVYSPTEEAKVELAKLKKLQKR